MPLTYPQFKEAIAFVGADGMIRDHEAYILYRVAGMLPAGAMAVEIGSWKGKSAVSIAMGLKESGGHLQAVDNFAGVENQPGWDSGDVVKAAFNRNVDKAGLTPLVTLNDLSSQNFSARWKQDVDFLFIDGCHLYEAAKFDIFAFMKYVKPGGWVAFHDIRMEDDVIRALREYLAIESMWMMEAFAWDNNLLALKRASSLATARPRGYLDRVLKLAPLTCKGIPPSSQPWQKIKTKIAQSYARFVFRRGSLVTSKDS